MVKDVMTGLILVADYDITRLSAIGVSRSELGKNGGDIGRSNRRLGVERFVFRF